jgi:hypothetical protein
VDTTCDDTNFLFCLLFPRVIANLDTEALPRLRAKIPNFDVEWDVDIVKHDNHRTPCTLMERLYDTDVLLTAHGFQVCPLNRLT